MQRGKFNLLKRNPADQQTHKQTCIRGVFQCTHGLHIYLVCICCTHILQTHLNTRDVCKCTTYTLYIYTLIWCPPYLRFLVKQGASTYIYIYSTNIYINIYIVYLFIYLFMYVSVRCSCCLKSGKLCIVCYAFLCKAMENGRNLKCDCQRQRQQQVIAPFPIVQGCGYAVRGFHVLQLQQLKSVRV